MARIIKVTFRNFTISCTSQSVTMVSRAFIIIFYHIDFDFNHCRGNWQIYECPEDSSSLYTFFIHCGAVRQLAKVISISTNSDHIEPSIGDQMSDASYLQNESPTFASWPQHAHALRYMHAHKIITNRNYNVSKGSMKSTAPTGNDSGNWNETISPKSTHHLLISDDDKSESSGRVAHIRFRFVSRPEFMQVGATLLVRDSSSTSGAGVVKSLLHAGHVNR